MSLLCPLLFTALFLSPLEKSPRGLHPQPASPPDQSFLHKEQDVQKCSASCSLALPRIFCHPPALRLIPVLLTQQPGPNSPALFPAPTQTCWMELPSPLSIQQPHALCLEPIPVSAAASCSCRITSFYFFLLLSLFLIALRCVSFCFTTA